MASCPEDMVDVFSNGGGDNNGEERQKSFLNSLKSDVQLFDLTIDVIPHILKFLDVENLMSLRCASIRTKGWIEQPAILRRIPVYLTNKTRRDEIVQSNIEWNNYVLNIIPNEPTDSLFPFFDRFSPAMKILTLHFTGEYSTISGRSLADLLFCFGPELEVLNFTGSMLNNYIVYNRTWIDQLEMSQMPKDNLVSLQHLNIDIDGLNEKSSKYLSGLIGFFLRNCPNLISAKLPIGFPFKDTIRLDRHETDCSALIDFMKRKLQIRDGYSFLQKKSNIVINFCAGRKYFHSCKEAVFPFRITSPVLIEIATFCESIGVKLFNVPSFALPNHKDASVLTVHELYFLNEAVTSVISINDMIMNLKNFYIPPSTTIRIIVKAGSDNTYAGLELPVSLNISSISVCAEYWELHPPGITLLCHQLLRTYRPTVTELEVIVANGQGNSWFSYLGNTFPSLQKLHLEGVPYCEFDTRLLATDIPNLEDLTICNLFIDFNKLLLQSDHQFLTVIKKLTHLRLINVDMENIANTSFRQLFRHMKPKTFIFRTDRRLYSQISFKNGISTLASIEGGFKDTVEYFECLIPEDTTRKGMEKFLTYFTKLKTSKLY